MVRSDRLALLLAGLLTLTVLACSYSPTSPFAGFDGKGSRLSGRFTSQASASAALRAQPQPNFDGITVYVRENTSITTTVRSNGTFTLDGIPEGTITVVFKRDDSVIGELTFRGVLANQEIRIVVRLTEGDVVVLVEQERDDDSSDDESNEDESDDSDDKGDEDSDEDSDDDSDSSGN